MRHTKHYVELLYPGLLFPETNVSEVAARDPALVADEKLQTRYGTGRPYGFRFFDRTFVWATDEEGERFERCVEEAHNYSAYYYPEAVVYTKAEIEALYDGQDHSVMLANMQANGWDRVVKTRRGNWQPYEEGRTIIL